MSGGIDINYSVRNKFRNLDLSNAYQLLITARKGVKPKVFYDFAEVANMPEKSLAGIINLSARTLRGCKNRDCIFPAKFFALIFCYLYWGVYRVLD